MNVAHAAGSSTRRATALLVAALLVAALGPPAAADHVGGHPNPCRNAPAATVFADYGEVRAVHRGAVDCALYRGITSGAGSNAEGAPLYRPVARVTRAQMAQFIVNTLVAAGFDADLPPAGTTDRFGDIADSFARAAINRLARARIVSGTSEGRYSPGAPVTREQMATFIVQAAEFALNDNLLGDGTARFGDVGATNVHRANIEDGADAGLFQGTTATTFSPGRFVVRDQMATFLVNLLRVVFDTDRAPAPPSAQVRLTSTTVDAGGDVTGSVTGTGVQSVSLSGCGLPATALSDRDGSAAGIQFAARIPDSQPAGSCTLVFTTTFTNGTRRTDALTITVQAGNHAAVRLHATEVPAGGAITGEITGSNIDSARVSGCGLNDEEVADGDAGAAGIQLSETIPAVQPAGQCTLTFRVRYRDGTSQSLSQVLTVAVRRGVTTRPELVTAQFVSTTSQGTIVRFGFDEPLVGLPDASRFYVYRGNATRLAATSAQLGSDELTVLARFAGITTTSQASALTLATVGEGATRDGHSQSNPEGHAALTASGRPAGITSAPDLRSAGGFRPGATSGTTAVDFTFDETTHVLQPSGFHLVLTTGALVDCQGPARDAQTAGGGSVPGGNGSARITTVCANPAGVTLSATSVARGYVDPAAVTDAPQATQPGNGPNALQVVDVAGDGLTPRPDLDSVVLLPGADPGDADRVLFRFDEPVTVTGNASLFRVYDASGREVFASAAQRSGSRNENQVTATFAAAALDNVVGAAVAAAAVTDEDGFTNQADELGALIPVVGVTSGRTAAPDLLSVALSSTGSGTVPETSAVYTFDEDLNPVTGAPGAAAIDAFLLYTADGQRLQCTGVAGTTFTIGTRGPERRQATCSAYRLPTGGAATAAQVAAAVLATVLQAAVDDREDRVTPNPEGAAVTTGGTGTPQ